MGVEAAKHLLVSMVRQKGVKVSCVVPGQKDALGIYTLTKVSMVPPRSAYC